MDAEHSCLSFFPYYTNSKHTFTATTIPKDLCTYTKLKRLKRTKHQKDEDFLTVRWHLPIPL